MRETVQTRAFPNHHSAAGCYHTTVGLISAGAIARQLMELLTTFDMRVIVYDPFLTEGEAKHLGVERVPLDQVFRDADVISLHTPHLVETEGLITGELLDTMKQGATFINTARGAVVREQELIQTARKRPDLHFVRDVTHPEPPAADSPLYTLPNIVLTPHIAGSVGAECRRMGRYMVEELSRFIANEPLRWAVTPALARYTSHRPVVHVNPKLARRPEKQLSKN